ncbi:hypothetical protein BESB_053020 [Besnoitia besnoiti]|uniref:Uncharacterized protein n=1 Tax=Besnoitia besnoiti TaxID=94643 RepID=A0A2A9MHA7_BESBE|nr:hypothetical protein BESB_053020 [Besnoitia besnoiti]PFH35651.1 hypothetical protein BESB_053020 [Besnoitia besnoiti]
MGGHDSDATLLLSSSLELGGSREDEEGDEGKGLEPQRREGARPCGQEARAERREARERGENREGGRRRCAEEEGNVHAKRPERAPFQSRAGHARNGRVEEDSRCGDARSEAPTQDGKHSASEKWRRGTQRDEKTFARGSLHTLGRGELGNVNKGGGPGSVDEDAEPDREDAQSPAARVCGGGKSIAAGIRSKQTERQKTQKESPRRMQQAALDESLLLPSLSPLAFRRRSLPSSPSPCTSLASSRSASRRWRPRGSPRRSQQGQRGEGGAREEGSGSSLCTDSDAHSCLRCSCCGRRATAEEAHAYGFVLSVSSSVSSSESDDSGEARAGRRAAAEGRESAASADSLRRLRTDLSPSRRKSREEDTSGDRPREREAPEAPGGEGAGGSDVSPPRSLGEKATGPKLPSGSGRRRPDSTFSAGAAEARGAGLSRCLSTLLGRRGRSETGRREARAALAPPEKGPASPKAALLCGCGLSASCLDARQSSAAANSPGKQRRGRASSLRACSVSLFSSSSACGRVSSASVPPSLNEPLSLAAKPPGSASGGMSHSPVASSLFFPPSAKGETRRAPRTPPSNASSLGQPDAHVSPLVASSLSLREAAEQKEVADTEKIGEETPAAGRKKAGETRRDNGRGNRRAPPSVPSDERRARDVGIQSVGCFPLRPSGAEPGGLAPRAAPDDSCSRRRQRGEWEEELGGAPWSHDIRRPSAVWASPRPPSAAAFFPSWKRSTLLQASPRRRHSSSPRCAASGSLTRPLPPLLRSVGHSAARPPDAACVPAPSAAPPGCFLPSLSAASSGATLFPPWFPQLHATGAFCGKPLAQVPAQEASQAGRVPTRSPGATAPLRASPVESTLQAFSLLAFPPQCEAPRAPVSGLSLRSLVATGQAAPRGVEGANEDEALSERTAALGGGVWRRTRSEGDKNAGERREGRRGWRCDEEIAHAQFWGGWGVSPLFAEERREPVAAEARKRLNGEVEGCSAYAPWSRKEASARRSEGSLGTRQEISFSARDGGSSADSNFLSLRRFLLDQKTEELRRQLLALDQIEETEAKKREARERREQSLRASLQSLKKKYRGLVGDFAFNLQLLRARDEELERTERFALDLHRELKKRERELEEETKQRAEQKRDREQEELARAAKATEERERQSEALSHLRWRLWALSLQLGNTEREREREKADMEARLARLNQTYEEELQTQRAEAARRRELELKKAEKNARHNLDDLVRKLEESEGKRRALEQKLWHSDDEKQALETREKENLVAISLLEEEVSHLRAEKEHAERSGQNVAAEGEKQIQDLKRQHAQEIDQLKRQLAEQKAHGLAAPAEVQKRHTELLERQREQERLSLRTSQSWEHRLARAQQETREALQGEFERERDRFLQQNKAAADARGELERQLQEAREKLSQREWELSMAEGRFLAAEALQQLPLLHGGKSLGGEFASIGAREASGFVAASPAQGCPLLDGAAKRATSAPMLLDEAPLSVARAPFSSPTPQRADARRENTPLVRAESALREPTQGATGGASLSAPQGEPKAAQGALFPGDLGTIHLSPLQLSPLFCGTDFGTAVSPHPSPGGGPSGTASSSSSAASSWPRPLQAAAASGRLVSPRFGDASEARQRLRPLLDSAWRLLAETKEPAERDEQAGCGRRGKGPEKRSRASAAGDAKRDKAETAESRRRTPSPAWRGATQRDRRRLSEGDTGVKEEELVAVLHALLGALRELDTSRRRAQRQLLAVAEAKATLQKEREQLMEITNRQRSSLHRLLDSPSSSASLAPGDASSAGVEGLRGKERLSVKFCETRERVGVQGGAGAGANRDGAGLRVAEQKGCEHDGGKAGHGLRGCSGVDPPRGGQRGQEGAGGMQSEGLALQVAGAPAFFSFQRKNEPVKGRRGRSSSVGRRWAQARASSSEDFHPRSLPFLPALPPTKKARDLEALGAQARGSSPSGEARGCVSARRDGRRHQPVSVSRKEAASMEFRARSEETSGQRLASGRASAPVTNAPLLWIVRRRQTEEAGKSKVEEYG